jgi:hypothetical protein
MNSHPPSWNSGSAADAESADRFEYDPVYLQSTRELGVIVLLFLGFFIWSVGACYWLGYGEGESANGKIAVILGMPAWVFWGIFLPWIGVDIAALWFCFFYMKDDDLGEAHEGDDLVRQVLKKQRHPQTSPEFPDDSDYDQEPPSKGGPRD